MKRRFATVFVVAVFVGGLTGCATKGYVNQNIAEVNEKVETLAEALEDTQEQTRTNADGVAEATRRADSASDSAADAGRSAADAGRAASVADDRAAAVGRDTERLMRLLYEVVLSQEQGNFGFGQADLPDAAKMEIDGLAQRLKSDSPGNVYIEIEGHTDSTGDPNVNEQLGLERAEAVKRYLHESHEIPLHRMNVISYGEDKPIAPNDTQTGRAQNRRVVVRVLT
jgi:outer membrane protein OmpA-like peptidoglycan-associated protein